MVQSQLRPLSVQPNLLGKMCGRYTITMDPDLMGRYYGAGFLEAPRPVFNASPGQRLPVILDAEPGTIRLAYWGFFVEFPGRSRRMLINARAETVHRHPTFRDSFRCRRCLVVADGFYEWKATATGKQPYRVVPEREGPCTFAGLWKEVEDGPAYVILTAAASPGLRAIHDRMPVMLARDQLAQWLDPGCGTDELRRLARPSTGGAIRFYQVSKRVNSSRNQGPELVVPVSLGPE